MQQRDIEQTLYEERCAKPGSRDSVSFNCTVRLWNNLPAVVLPAVPDVFSFKSNVRNTTSFLHPNLPVTVLDHHRARTDRGHSLSGWSHKKKNNNIHLALEYISILRMYATPRRTYKMQPIFTMPIDSDIF